MMTDDERAAREWLDRAIGGRTYAEDQKNKATILRLFDRPVLPRGADVPESVLKAMLVAYQEGLREPGPYWTVMRAVVDALHAHLTAPPPAKKVEVWGLAFANGGVMSFGHKEYTRLMAMHYPGSRVVKLVEAADDQ